MYPTYNTKLAASLPELHEAANIDVILVLLFKVGSHDEKFRISLVQNFVPGYGLFYGKKAPLNNQRFC
jgi:hypothetical protein